MLLALINYIKINTFLQNKIGALKPAVENVVKTTSQNSEHVID